MDPITCTLLAAAVVISFPVTATEANFAMSLSSELLVDMMCIQIVTQMKELCSVALPNAFNLSGFRMQIHFRGYWVED